MENNLQNLLQISAKLFQHLTTIPNDESRDLYIEKIHEYLDERSAIVENLQETHFVYDPNNKTHQMLFELDKGIKKRLDKVLSIIQDELKTIQNSKKNEKQYMNPYASVQVMDGRYYDQKK